MRYTLTRLCGGEALLLTPREEIPPIQLEVAQKGLSEEGVEASLDGMMLIMRWREMEVTVYENGKIMFYPLREKSEALEHAADLMEYLRRLAALEN